MSWSFDFDTLFAKLNSETPRACAVLGGALLHDRLGELIRRRLSFLQDELLGELRPLGTFSGRTLLARAMDWIVEDARHDLDQIRKIRNAFAHRYERDFSFDDMSIAGRCRGLRTAQAFLTGLDDSAIAPDQVLDAHALQDIRDRLTTPHGRFELTILFLLQYLEDPSKDLIWEVHDTAAAFRVRFSVNDAVSTPT